MRIRKAQNLQPAQVYYDAHLDAVCIEWTGHAFGPVYRNIIQKAVELQKETNADYIISDMRKGRVVRKEDENWLFRNVLSTENLTNIKGIAMLVGDNLFRELLALKVERNSRYLPIECQYFNNPIHLHHWLHSKNEAELKQAEA